jgi:hypothetical protein
VAAMASKIKTNKEFDFTFGLDFDDPPELEAPDERVEPQGIKTRARSIVCRSCYGEQTLESLFGYELEKDTAYHVISGGDIDNYSYLKFILRQQKIHYCLLSTWVIAWNNVAEIERNLETGRMARLDIYVGEILKKSYKDKWDALCDLMRKHGGRVALFRNHSKIVVGFGDKFNFVLESSANMNQNPRTENTVITTNTELALFYKAFFDGIKSFERNFDDWRPFDVKQVMKCQETEQKT